VAEIPEEAGEPNADHRASRHVEKIQVPVRLAQPSLDPRDGSLMLLPRVGAEARTESLLEHLNSRRTVIPFITEDDRSTLLVNRISIDWILASPSTPPDCLLPPGVEWNRGERAELLFADRRRVEVEVEWYAENSEQRLSDFLNMCDTFVASRTRFGMLIWNKSRVLEWRILGPPAPPRTG
jgi:hypothetical protein